MGGIWRGCWGKWDDGRNWEYRRGILRGGVPSWSLGSSASKGLLASRLWSVRERDGLLTCRYLSSSSMTLSISILNGFVSEREHDRAVGCTLTCVHALSACSAVWSWLTLQSYVDESGSSDVSIVAMHSGERTDHLQLII